jgi:uncharacterized iron-regulated membrane protein
MRKIHRIVSLFVLVFTLFLGVTGTLIQSIDLRTLLRHAPPTDPDMMAIREDHDGPGDYAVLKTADFTAATLPAGFDFQAALPKLLSAAHAAFGAAPVSYVEFRGGEGAAVGRVLSGKQTLRYDFEADKAQIEPPVTREQRPEGLRNTVKGIHRMTTFGDWALWINPLVGIALGVFLVTGLVMYFQLLSARSRIGRSSWFWSAGGWWRALHRWTAVVAALFMTVVALSGTFLAYESLVFGIYMAHHRPQPGQPPPVRPSATSPLNEAQLPAMLGRTLDAYGYSQARVPLKVLRLRIYGGMPQGVVVSGLDDDTQQVVFNAMTGRQVSETEPGYPETGFPFGWQAHQVAKQIHRGDYIGLSGRWMDLFAGLSLIFFSVSGAVMYYDMWQRRRRSGRNALIW